MKKLIALFVFLNFTLLQATSVGLDESAREEIQTRFRKVDVVKKDVIIGVQLNMSGDKKEESEDIKNAFHIVEDTYQKNPQYIDKNIKMIFCDDKGSINGSLICADKFMKNKVAFVIGSNTTQATLASSPIYISNMMLQISTTTSSEYLRANKNSNNISLFRTSFSDESESSYIGSYIIGESYSKIAIVGDQSYYSQGKQQDIYEAIRDMSGNIVLNMSLTKDLSNLDFIMNNIKDKADIVVYAGTYSGALALTSKMNSATKTMKFIGTSILDTSLFYSKLEKAMRTRVLISNIRGIHTFKRAKTIEFIQAFKDKTKSYPKFISMYQIVDALELLLYVVGISGNTNTRVASKVMRGITDFEGNLGFISMQDSGDRFNTGFEMYALDLEGNLIGYNNPYNKALVGISEE